MANASSLLWHFFHAQTESESKSASEAASATAAAAVNWTGFYVRADQFPGYTAPQAAESSPTSSASLPLLLGPFNGKPACQLIRPGTGVCGAAAAAGHTLIVPDVHAFPGHVACDAASRSEVVVPVRRASEGDVVGVLDIDCAVENGFDEVDRDGLEKFAGLLGRGCDWF